MTPVAAAMKRKPEPESVAVPEVHEALARRHAADIERQDRMLKAYLEAVTLAAEGKPIPPATADAAVEAAHALGLKASRLDADIDAMRRALSCERQETDHLAKSGERQTRLHEIKLEIAAAERLLRELQAERHRLSMSGHGLLGWAQERNALRRDFPHLFLGAADMDEKHWRHVRA